MTPVAAFLEVRLVPGFLSLSALVSSRLGLSPMVLPLPRPISPDCSGPKSLRGVTMMLCLLPATRLALDGWPENEIADASGLFNLMRNLGGAIGIL